MKPAGEMTGTMVRAMRLQRSSIVTGSTTLMLSTYCVCWSAPASIVASARNARPMMSCTALANALVSSSALLGTPPSSRRLRAP
jgi:hypothetical protein